MAVERWRPGWGLMRGGPWRELARMEREMEDVFGRFFPEWPWARGAAEGRGWAPAVDMLDRKDEVVIRADLPGLEQKDIEVNVDQGVLTIRGQRKGDQGSEGEEDRGQGGVKANANDIHRVTPRPGNAGAGARTVSPLFCRSY